MKKLIYLCLFIPFLSFSQITVTSNNLPSIGDTVITAYDNNTFLPGPSGSNLNWDFSSAAGPPEMLLSFIDPLSTPYPSTFPASNICVKLDSAMYYYLNKSVNGLAAVGFVDAGMVYPYNKMLLPASINYLDTITNTDVLFEFDTLITPPAPSVFAGIFGPYTIDSVKIIVGNTQQYIVDGWGQVQIPNGAFDALRVFETNLEFENTLYKLTDTILGSTQWVPDANNAVYFESSFYSWRTNDPTVNWSLAEIEVDSLGNPDGDLIYYLGNSLSNIVISPAMVDLDKLINVSCNGANDGFIILDVFGTAYPLTFSWTGPNGFTSTNQDIFNLAAGTYIITVTDANGNSTTETYTVSEPPLLTAMISQSMLDLTANVNGGTPPYNYTWNTGDTLPTITPLNNGNYTCIVTDKQGCTATLFFTVSNVPTSIVDINSNKELIKVTDFLGRKSRVIKKTPLFYIYRDGTVEKRIFLE